MSHKKTTSLSLTNAGFSAYTAKIGDRRLRVAPFSTQQVPLSLLAAAGYEVDVTLDSNLAHYRVKFSSETGEVVSPAFLNKRIAIGDPKNRESLTRQVLRASKSRPFELKSWTIVAGSPWFCVVSSTAAALLIASAVLLAVVLTRSK